MNWSVLPHPGGPLQPHDLWTAWNTDLWVLVPMALASLIYLWGILTLWGRAGIGRGISVRRAMSFLGGTLGLFIALISPLDALSDVLFSAHMTQHLILMMIAAPLFVMSSFPVALFAALPSRWAHTIGQGWNRSKILPRVWSVLSHMVSAWLLFAIVFWAWHAPLLFEGALKNTTIHTLEHLFFLLTAMLYWWVLFRQTTQKHLQYGLAVLYLFTTILHTGILGALMTFTSEPWYPYYTTRVLAWGMTPLQDQQLAGLIMWMPGGAVFTLLAILYFAAWLRALEQRSARVHYSNSLPISDANIKEIVEGANK